MLLTAVIIVLIAGAWTVWEARRDRKEQRRAAEGELGWLIIKAVAVAVLLLVLGLVLDGLGVRAGGYVVLGAFALYLIAMYVTPFWPSRRG